MNEKDPIPLKHLVIRVILTQVMGRRQWSPFSLGKLLQHKPLDWCANILRKQTQTVLPWTAGGAYCQQLQIRGKKSKQKKTNQTNKQNENSPHPLKNKPETRFVSPQL